MQKRPTQGWRPRWMFPGRDPGQVHRSSVRKAPSERRPWHHDTRSGYGDCVDFQREGVGAAYFRNAKAISTCSVRLWWSDRGLLVRSTFQRVSLESCFTSLIVYKNTCLTPSKMRDNSPHCVPLYASPYDFRPPRDMRKTPSSITNNAVNRHEATLILSWPPRRPLKV
jgi:hypothetical protein